MNSESTVLRKAFLPLRGVEHYGFYTKFRDN